MDKSITPPDYKHKNHSINIKKQKYPSQTCSIRQLAHSAISLMVKWWFMSFRCVCTWLGVDICIRVFTWTWVCLTWDVCVVLDFVNLVSHGWRQTGTPTQAATHTAHIHTHSGGEQLEQILRQPVIKALIPKVPPVTVIRQPWFSEKKNCSLTYLLSSLL